MVRPRRVSSRHNVREATPERAGSVPRTFPLDSPEYAAKLTEMRNSWQLASLMQFVTLFKGMLKLGVPTSDVAIEVLEEDLLGINMVPILLDNVLKSLIQGNLEPRFQTGSTGGDLDFIYTRKARQYLVKPKVKPRDQKDVETDGQADVNEQESGDPVKEEVDSHDSPVHDEGDTSMTDENGTTENGHHDDEEPVAQMKVKTDAEVKEELSIVSSLPEFEVLFKYTSYNSVKQRFHGFDFSQLDVFEKIALLHQLTVWMACDPKFREKLEAHAKTLGVYIDYFRMEPVGYKGDMISYYLLDDMRLYSKTDYAPDTSDVVVLKPTKDVSATTKPKSKNETQNSTNAGSKIKTGSKRRSTKTGNSPVKKARRSLRSQNHDPSPRRRSSRRLAALEQYEEDEEEENGCDDDQDEEEGDEEGDPTTANAKTEEEPEPNGSSGVTMAVALAREYEPTWTCLCWDLDSWRVFLKKLQKSRDHNEAQLYKFVQTEVFPQVEEYEQTRIAAALHREKQREKIALVANRKRSSRIEENLARQRQEEAERARAEKLQQEERERKRRERERARKEQARNKLFIEKRLEKFSTKWQKLQQKWEHEFLASLESATTTTSTPVDALPNENNQVAGSNSAGMDANIETRMDARKEAGQDDTIEVSTSASITASVDTSVDTSVETNGETKQEPKQGTKQNAKQVTRSETEGTTGPQTDSDQSSSIISSNINDQSADAVKSAQEEQATDVSTNQIPDSSGKSAPKPVNKELLALLGSDAYGVLDLESGGSRRVSRERKPRSLDNDFVTISQPLASRTRNRASRNQVEDEEMWYFRCPTCGVEGINIDDGNPSVACERCNCWVHLSCLPEAEQNEVNNSQSVDTGYTFVCSICQDEEAAEREKIANEYWKKKKRAEEYKERRRKKKEAEAKKQAEAEAEKEAQEEARRRRSEMEAQTAQEARATAQGQQESHDQHFNNKPLVNLLGNIVGQSQGQIHTRDNSSRPNTFAQPGQEKQKQSAVANPHPETYSGQILPPFRMEVSRAASSDSPIVNNTIGNPIGKPVLLPTPEFVSKPSFPGTNVPPPIRKPVNDRIRQDDPSTMWNNERPSIPRFNYSTSKQSHGSPELPNLGQSFHAAPSNNYKNFQNQFKVDLAPSPGSRTTLPTPSAYPQTSPHQPVVGFAPHPPLTVHQYADQQHVLQGNTMTAGSVGSPGLAVEQQQQQQQQQRQPVQQQNAQPTSIPTVVPPTSTSAVVPPLVPPLVAAVQQPIDTHENSSSALQNLTQVHTTEMASKVGPSHPSGSAVGVRGSEVAAGARSSLGDDPNNQRT